MTIEEPCPFCGRHAAIPTVEVQTMWNPDGIEVHSVLCQGCGTKVYGKLNTRASAIECWNTRAAQEPKP